MTLKDWRGANGVTQTAFAERLGVMPHHVSRWESGERTPSLELAVRIEDATDGAVAAREWLADE